MPRSPAIAARPAEDAVSFKLGLANGDLGVAGSLALNFIGWDARRTRIPDARLARVDALIGTRLRRAPRQPWIVQAYIRNSTSLLPATSP